MNKGLRLPEIRQGLRSYSVNGIEDLMNKGMRQKIAVRRKSGSDFLNGLDNPMKRDET